MNDMVSIFDFDASSEESSFDSQTKCSYDTLSLRSVFSDVGAFPGKSVNTDDFANRVVRLARQNHAGFTIVHANTERVSLARDPIGLCSIYYYLDRRNNQLLVSSDLSDLKEFASLRGLRLTWSKEYFFRYLLELPYDWLTPFEEIGRLQRGHLVCFSSGGVMLDRRYWSWSEELTANYPDQGKVLCVLEDCIQKLLSGYENITVQVSGGFDSSAILCLLGEVLNVKPNAFSFVFPSFPRSDERQYLAALEEYADIDEFVFEPSEMPSWSENPFLSAGEPGALLDTAMLGPISRKLKNYGAIFTGYGGDQLWRGDMAYLADLLRQFEVVSFIRELLFAGYERSCGPWTIMRKYVMPEWRENGFCTAVPQWISHDLLRTNHLVDKEDRLPPDLRMLSCTVRSRIADLSTSAGYQWADENIYGRFGATRLHPFYSMPLIREVMNIEAKFRKWRGNDRILMRSVVDGIVPKKILSRKCTGVTGDFYIEIIRNNVKYIEHLVEQHKISFSEFVDITNFEKQLKSVKFGVINDFRLRNAINLLIWIAQQ